MKMLVAMFLALAALTETVTAGEPRVPPGLSNGGIRVAFLGAGIDYTLPELKGHLARDGEGDLISLDLTDNDTRPYAPSGSPGTRSALAFARLAPAAELIIVKERPRDPQSFGHMMTFVANTPARIVAWLDGAPERADWPILAEAARRFRDRLFVIPAGDVLRDLDVSAAYEGLRNQPNVIIVGSASSRPDHKSNFGKTTVSTVVWERTPDRTITSRDAAILVVALVARALAAKSHRATAELKNIITKPQPTGVAFQAGWLTRSDAEMAFKAK